MKRRHILFALLLLFAAAQPAFAADIEVNASCSLPNAIISANTDASVGGCTAGTTGADTITITAAGTTNGGTITLSSQLIVNGS